MFFIWNKQPNANTCSCSQLFVGFQVWKSRIDNHLAVAVTNDKKKSNLRIGSYKFASTNLYVWNKCLDNGYLLVHAKSLATAKWQLTTIIFVDNFKQEINRQLYRSQRRNYEVESIFIRGVIRKFAENSRHFYTVWSIELRLQHMILQHICSWWVTTCLMLVVYVCYGCRQGNAIWRKPAQFTLDFDILLHNQLNFNVL